MRRSWLSMLVVAMVLGLLAGLAALQYHWQRQVSAADREKMRKRVEIDANRFAEDFNREIQAAYFNFQTDADGWREGQPADFNDRYDYWRAKTAYPELIRDFYFFENRADAATLRYDSRDRKFTEVDAPEDIKNIRGRILMAKDVRPFYDVPLALVLPVHGAERRIDKILVGERPGPGLPVLMPERFGNLVIMLDREAITGRLLPDLVSKYFADGEYNVAVVGQGEQSVFGSTTASDARVPLFDLSPDHMVMFAGRDVLSHIAEARRQGVIVNQRVETLSTTRSNTNGDREAGTFKIELQNDVQGVRKRVLTAAVDPNDAWTLNVQHQAGSVDAYVTNVFRRNLVIGAGLYALLAAAILGIFFSAQRAKNFAQRQVDFVSSVSHEFRTPLAVIYSAGENLADGVAADAEQVARYGDLIKGEGRKLSAMVEQILEFAGANSGKQKYHFAEADVAEIVRSAIAECEPLIRAGDFTVETDIADALPPVEADKASLSRAIQNLIANAVKYSIGNRWIRISARNGGGGVNITVEDKGIGISAPDLRQIFEPFFRAKEVVDAQIHGNGLGLSLVKQIVEAHGGKVSAESESGLGSKFTIELPVRN